MRVLIGLAALVASVNAQLSVVAVGSNSGQTSLAPPLTGGSSPQSTVYVYAVPAQAVPTTVNYGSYAVTGNLVAGSSINAGVSSTLNSGSLLSPGVNYAITLPYSVAYILFTFTNNNYVAQMQYKWSPNYPNQCINAGGPTTGCTSFFTGTQSITPTSYLCDICTTVNSATNCNTGSGPGNAPSPAGGYNCASSTSSAFTRTYIVGPLQASTTAASFVNNFQVQVWEQQSGSVTDTTSYSFFLTRTAPAVTGDPQISGLQGQDFQVHGMPDEIFNMITYPNLQVNARFVYLSSGACHDNFTACFAHPGTYISEEGIRLGKDKIHVTAGSYKKGLTVSVNGNKITGKSTLKLGAVNVISHRRVNIKTPIMDITISNSDKFLNQETALFDEKLLA
jgi:hypothetical protein